MWLLRFSGAIRGGVAPRLLNGDVRSQKLCGAGALWHCSNCLERRKQIAIKIGLPKHCGGAGFVRLIDAIASWEIKYRDDGCVIAQHLRAKCSEIGGLGVVQLAAVPDAGDGAACVRSRLSMSLPGCGVVGVTECIGECVGVVTVRCSQHD